MQLTPEQITDYLHRSYTAVDGLWFRMVEDRFGFDTALQLDHDVWRVLPKIQARTLKKLLNLSTGLQDLYQAFTTKLTLDRFQFTAQMQPDNLAFTIEITQCPWLALLEKANRTHLAATIAERICTAEYTTWAAEFGTNITVQNPCQLCKNHPACTLTFSC